MVKFHIVIKTKDRSPRKNFLGETLLNLKRAGVFTSSHLGSFALVDSGSPASFFESLPLLNELELLPDFSVDSASRNLHQNARRCIELSGSRAIASLGWAMVLEDDLDVCNEFLESTARWLADHAVDAPQMYVLGANSDQIRGVASKGGTMWAYPVGAFYGAQALVWQGKHAVQLAEFLGPDPNYNGTRDHGHDLLLQRWGRETKIPHFMATAPSFVQHIGNESGIGNRFFQFQSWPGREWRYERP